VEELNLTGDPRTTSLKNYTHFFEHRFVRPLEADCAKELGFDIGLDY